MEFFNENNLELAVNPMYSAPVFAPVSGKKWIPYLDADKSQYPDKLLYYKNNSALHGAIVRSIGRQYAGNGFTYDTSSNLSKKTEEFLTNFNEEGQDANDVLPMVAQDLYDFGGFSLAVIWSKDYKTIIGVEHVDFSKLRAALADPSTGKIPGYFYSFNWNTQRPAIIYIPAYSELTAKEHSAKYDEAKKAFDLDPKNLEQLEQFFKEPTTQIMYVKPYQAGQFYYPLPQYVGATNAILTSILTDQYGVNSMENGLSVDYIVKFIGDYSDDAKKTEAQSFLNQHARASKKKRPIIAFSKIKEEMMEVDNISGINEDKSYTKINENAQQEILCGHGVVSPMLVGIKTPGSLGGSEEIKTAEMLFYKTVIKPGQHIITKAFNRIMDINGLEELEIERLTIIDTGNTEIPEASGAPVEKPVAKPVV